MSDFTDSVWLLQARESQAHNWRPVRAYSLMNDLATDERMLRRIMPNWEFNVVEVEYVA